MVRLLLFLALLCLAALGLTWFAGDPGEIGLRWQGYRVETSLMVATGVVSALAFLIALLWGIIRALTRPAVTKS
jgi:HemY protein